jgi:hypothetical protein
VTIDAIGCQTDIAQLIVEQEAEYVLAVKGNQGTLRQDIQDLFAYAQEIGFKDVAYDFHQTVNGGCGRIEIRRHWTISKPDFLEFLEPQGVWAGLQSIGMVEAQRRIGDEISYETR